MRNQKLFYHFISAFVGLLTASVANAESESPIQCGLHKDKYASNIKCTVIVDNAQVDNVVLNRGRCEAPGAATKEDTAALEKYIENVKSESKGEADAVIGYALQMKLGLLIMNPNRTPQENSVVRAIQDPRGKYQFGDEFSIAVPISCNLIEYTIDLDGVSWTWSM